MANYDKNAEKNPSSPNPTKSAAKDAGSTGRQNTDIEKSGQAKEGKFSQNVGQNSRNQENDMDREDKE